MGFIEKSHKNLNWLYHAILTPTSGSIFPQLSSSSSLQGVAKRSILCELVGRLAISDYMSTLVRVGLAGHGVLCSSKVCSKNSAH